MPIVQKLPRAPTPWPLPRASCSTMWPAPGNTPSASAPRFTWSSVRPIFGLTRPIKPCQLSPTAEKTKAKNSSANNSRLHVRHCAASVISPGSNPRAIFRPGIRCRKARSFRFSNSAAILPTPHSRSTAASRGRPRVSTFRVSAVTNNIPFPSAEAYAPGRTYVPLPYLAFDISGQADSESDEYHSPCARQRELCARRQQVGHARRCRRCRESPAGNSTNAFSLVHIDWLTGRARLEKQEFP